MICDACHKPIPGIRWHYSASPVVTCGRCHADIVNGSGIRSMLRVIEKRKALSSSGDSKPVRKKPAAKKGLITRGRLAREIRINNFSGNAPDPE